jgi:hypothetical protein
MAKNSNKSKPLPIYIINGPNLNLPGTDASGIYGYAGWMRPGN